MSTASMRLCKLQNVWKDLNSRERPGLHLRRLSQGLTSHLIFRCLAFVETTESHPFVQHELLMPIVGVVRVPDVTEAIACAVRVEHGNGHTATMHSSNINNLHAMARIINTSIFVKNVYLLKND